MNKPIWINSEYVTIGSPPFFRLEGKEIYYPPKKVHRLALISLEKNSTIISFLWQEFQFRNIILEVVLTRGNTKDKMKEKRRKQL